MKKYYLMSVLMAGAMTALSQAAGDNSATADTSADAKVATEQKKDVADNKSERKKDSADKKAEQKKDVADKKSDKKKDGADKKKDEKIKDQMSLADARSQIDKVISAATSALMRSIMRRLSSEDQKQFLADVNKAIGDLPASVEEKTATYLNLNHAAIVSAQEGNVPVLLAEVFATVPPESLTVLSERFASDLLNRSADLKVTYTDEQFKQLSLDLMKVINERTAETDIGSARSAFAIIMLVRASNGSPEDLADTLIDTLPHDDVKDMARTEWIPAALGKDGREQGYEALLAAADAGRRPDFQFTLVIAGPQHLESVLEDISGKNVDEKSFIATRTPVLDAVQNPLIYQRPIARGDTAGGELKPNAEETKPSAKDPDPDPEPEPEEPEPKPYGGQ